MSYLKAVLFIGVLTTQIQNIDSSAAVVDELDGNPANTVYIKDYFWQKNYNETIEFIKQHEGFMPKAYYCSAGYLTIGYGHVIKKGENFSTPLTKAAADKLLKKDFDIALKAVKRTTNLSGSKELAMAHFVFSMGIGNFNRSTIKKDIKNNRPIDNSILKWSYYTNKNGQKVKSEVAYRLREWELKMYNRDTQKLYNVNNGSWALN